MNRRKFVTFLGGLAAAWPFALLAQQQGRIPRIGFLVSETLSGQSNRIEALRSGLRELGYFEGSSIAIEIRSADGKYERLPELAAELVRLKVDVLIAFGNKAVVAARGATTTIPIVVPSSGDPIAMGLVRNLSRPSGNVTGLSNFGTELSSKWLELLKEAVPRTSRVAVLVNAANVLRRPTVEAMRAAAKSLKLELQDFEVRSSAELANAFAAMARKRTDAVWVSGDTLFQAHFEEIANLAARHRLSSVGRTEFADAGGLIGYSVDDAGQYKRAAYFVDRILKGAKPADLPVERPTKIDLVINGKTARTLGLSVPQSILVRADRVIE